MEKIIFDMMGVIFKVFLRYWCKDSNDRDILASSLIDITEFAQNCGLSFLDAKKFNRSIEDFIDKVAYDFINEFGTQVENEERRMTILCQIKKDIQKINLNEENIVLFSNNLSGLQLQIANQSKEERKHWSEIEISVYTNCVKYISKMGMDFISKLPTFSSSALKIIISRQKEYSDKLDDILTEIHSMADLVKNSESQYREYESIYREKIIEKYGKIELIGSKLQDRHVKRYDITSAYVELSCISDKTREELELSKVFKDSNIVWVKGEAGAGKTTFLQWIAICSAKGERVLIENIDNTLPIVIGLRNIDWPLDLSNIVNRLTASEGIYCPDGWIHTLLKKQEVLLLFDGLDEISKSKRNDIYDYIEDTIEKYPKIKILLTARTSVKDNINCIKSCYEIVPMKLDRIRDFIEYWHNAVLRRDAIIEDSEIECLQYNLKQRIVESQSLKDLARNPLLCAMLCALNYVNNEQLPENKMHLFEQCCEMLMDARDSQRNIDTNIYENIPKMDYLMKRRILEEIAFRMMNSGVSSESKSNIAYFMQKLLNETNIISDSKNNYSVDNILDFLIERSGIIREPETGVIDFIHKTFMEFLAVKTICRNADWGILVKEACNVNWRETIIMCFGEMNNIVIDNFLKQLVAKGKEKHDDRYYLMASLCVSNAKFFYSPIIKEITEKIKEMIPPSEEKMEEMAELGLHLLIFLKNSEDYSFTEKYNCLKLLAIIKLDETIPIILSYIKCYSDPSSIPIFQFAADLLWQYSNSALEEYNVKEYLLQNMLSYVNGDKLITCETILYILNEYSLSSHDAQILKEVKRMIILGQNSKNQKGGKTDFGKYFPNCQTVRIIGNTKSLSFLSQFIHIRRLEIESNTHLVLLTYELKVLKNLISVTTLHIQTDQSEILYINRLTENMKNLEIIEIILKSPNLTLKSDTFGGFPYLKEVRFGVDETLAKEIETRIDEIEGIDKNLKVLII